MVQDQLVSDHMVQDQLLLNHLKSRTRCSWTIWSWTINNLENILSQMCFRIIFEMYTAPEAWSNYAPGVAGPSVEAEISKSFLFWFVRSLVRSFVCLFVCFVFCFCFVLFCFVFFFEWKDIIKYSLGSRREAIISVKISGLVCVVSHLILLSTKTARYSVIIWPSLWFTGPPSDLLLANTPWQVAN